MSIVFCIIVLGVALAIIGLVAPASRTRVALGIAGWLAITAIAAASGAVALDGGVPRVAAIPMMAIAVGLVVLRPILVRIPHHRLIALQAFRLPVELVLWTLFLRGIVPVQMTFEGRNFDVLVGLTAIPFAVLAAKRPRLAIAWHVFGLALLLNIVGTAVLSMPGPLRSFMTEPANTVIGTFPYVWLPGFLVPVAFLLHIAGIQAARRA